MTPIMKTDLSDELYDLEKDLYEKKDVSSKHPEIVEKANKILKKESVKDIHWPYSGGVFKK